ncbi:MAG: hypothetical protein RLZZ385_780 [Pseudomonadota bacterium]
MKSLRLGNSSYVLYLIHAAPFKELLGMGQVPTVVHFRAISLLAIIVHQLIEKPCRLLLRGPPSALKPVP